MTAEISLYSKEKTDELLANQKPKAPIYVQDTAPTVESGSIAIWIDSSDDYVIKVYNGTSWFVTTAVYD